ncbi:hypothetical protein C1646_773351 [Rhizophagus diaphanus]|nr:hypothetical protein C1646_773351 [Rhizophagus diaphanus] [Rhizophagus sp. MUCL 43196]
MKYNFSNNIFKISVNKDILKVYVPLTQLIPINSFNIFNYIKISDDILSDIYIVLLPNFTSYDPKIKAKTGIVYFLRKILFPPGYKNLDNNNFSSFLKIEKKKGLFSFLSWSYLSDEDFSDMREFVPKYIIGIFYYTGIYLLAIEFSQMKKYKSKYFTLFNILDLSSIILGMFNFTLILIFNGNYSEWIILATSVITLILWIELVMFVLFGHPLFNNLNPSNPTYSLKNGNETENLTLTETDPDNPFDTIWNAILSTYYWSTLNLNVYEYWLL